MTFVKHPNITEDTEICIATPKGPVNLKAVAGVFDWPDDIPVHRGFVEAPAPEELIEEQRRKAKGELLAKARELGLTVLDESELQSMQKHTDNVDDSNGGREGLQGAVVDDIADKEVAVAKAQEALDADPENADLKKALSAAKAALTKAKNKLAQ